MTTTVPETIACPLCDSGVTHTLEFETGLYTLQAGERIVACASCGFVYLNPRTPAGAMREEWYDSESYYAYYEKSCGTVGYQDEDAAPHLKERLQRIETMRGGKGRLLDVGSGKGYFLAHAQKMGWKVQGVEISAFGAKFASEHLQVPVIRGTLEEAKIETASFDIVHMNHVLEHISDLTPFLSEVRRVLAPGGLFVIEVPNQLEHLGYVLRKRWATDLLRSTKKGEVNFHTSFFTKKSLAQLLQMHGFSPKAVEARTWIPSLASKSVAGRGVKYGLWKLENLTERGENIVAFASLAVQHKK